MAKWARGDFKHGGKELLCLIEGQSETEEIRTPRMGVFFIARRADRGVIGQDLPGGSLGEEFFAGGFGRKIGGKGIPPVVIAIVEDGSGTQNLLDAGGILADHTDDHINKLV